MPIRRRPLAERIDHFIDGLNEAGSRRCPTMAQLTRAQKVCERRCRTPLLNPYADDDECRDLPDVQERRKRDLERLGDDVYAADLGTGLRRVQYKLEPKNYYGRSEMQTSLKPSPMPLMTASLFGAHAGRV